jgi:hypothetical protein
VIAMLDQSRLELVEQFHRLFNQPGADTDSHKSTDSAPLMLDNVLCLLYVVVCEIKIYG